MHRGARQTLAIEQMNATHHSLLIAWATVGCLSYVACAAPAGNGTPGSGAGSTVEAGATESSERDGSIVDSDATDASERDGSVVDSGAMDAGERDATASCDLSKEFGPPQPVAELNTSDDEREARIAPNGLELFLSRLGPDDSESIYRYARATLSAPWSSPTVQDIAIAGARRIRGLAFVSDTEAYVSAAGTAVSAYRITRASVGAPWSPAVLLPAGGPATGLNVGASGLYLVSVNSTLSASYAVSFAPRISPTSYGAQVAQGALTSYRSLALTKDELTAYVSPGFLGNVFRATRASIASPWSTPMAVVPVNDGSASTEASWVSPDHCELYLTSSRAGNMDIFVARRPR